MRRTVGTIRLGTLQATPWDGSEQLRYRVPTSDSNRARRPSYEHWQLFSDVVGNDLAANSSVLRPNEAIYADKTAKMRELDRHILSLFVSRIAISDILAEAFAIVIENHIGALQWYNEKYPKTPEERLKKSSECYRWT
ncbi:MAG: hypothetical protein ACRBB0_22305 [Pelagimonas sp.]|uniref:hypothetical protein n=1 Tax=Pelagimonas sp. TaxID=2073170 RepID=UPI003D6A05F2